MLPLKDEFPGSFHLAAVSFQNNIFVFGGYAPPIMYIFTEEGDLVEDLSDKLGFPTEMGCGSYAVRNGKMFAVFELLGNKLTMKSFDGVHWCEQRVV